MRGGQRSRRAGVAIGGSRQRQHGWAPVVVAATGKLARAAVEAARIPSRRRGRRLAGRQRPCRRPPLQAASGDGMHAAAPSPAAQLPRPPSRVARRPTAERPTRRAGSTASTSPMPRPTRRLAWQKKTLAELEQEIAKRIALLEAKTAEYQNGWRAATSSRKKAQRQPWCRSMRACGPTRRPRSSRPWTRRPRPPSSSSSSRARPAPS